MAAEMRTSILMMLIVVLLAPATAASSSGMNFLNATTATAADAYTNSVTTNANNTLIASSYGTFVEIHNASSLELVERFSLEREIFDIDFSPNGQYIAVSTFADTTVPNSIRVINVNDMSFKSEMARGNIRPGNIDWSYDGSMLIAPNINNGASVFNSTHMGEIFGLNGIHTSDVTCVAFSRTGEFMLTGDELGRLQLWDNTGEPIDVEINVDEEIVGCDFSDMDVKFAAATKSGNVYSYTVSGDLLQSRDFGENFGVRWSYTEDILYVLESDSNPELKAIDGSTFSDLHSTRLVHMSLDFSIIESNGMLAKFYVSTNTNHIAIYGSPPYPEGYGMMGSDLDGDNVPDTLDMDDDGDSFKDDWDFNCLNVTLCSREPDLTTIRSIVVSLDSDTLIVEDIYTMSSENTYMFRNLSRRSILADQRISYEETNMIESAFCNNMDKNDYLQRLENSLELSFGQVANGTLQCEILAGLSFSKTFDKEQLQFSFRTSFDVSPNISLPLTIYFDNQISVLDSSITHMVENHPILIEQITLEGDSLTTLWWNSDGDQKPQLNFTAIPQQASQINTFVELLNDNIILISASVTGLTLLIWVLIRRRNLNSLILDDSEFDEELNLEESMEQSYLEYVEDEYTKPQPIVDDGFTNLQVEDEPIITETIPSEERPTDRRAFMIDDDEEVSVKRSVRRRTGRVDRNAQGPIMSTKRKRLDGKLDIPGEKLITAKKPVRRGTKDVITSKKVRRVKTVKKDD